MVVKLMIDVSGKDATFISNCYRWQSGLSTLHLYRNPPERLPASDKVKENVDLLQQAYEGGANGDRVQIAIRKKARKDVTEMYKKILHYLESIATEDDIPALIQTGFEVQHRASRRRAASAVAT